MSVALEEKLDEVEAAAAFVTRDFAAERAEILAAIQERDAVDEQALADAIEKYEKARESVNALDVQTAHAREEFYAASVADARGEVRDVGAWHRFQGYAAQANAERLQLHALLARAISLGAENLNPLPRPGEGDQ